MKRLSRILLTLIALILTVTMISSCGILNIIANYVVTGLESVSGPVDYTTLEYERPDFEEIHAIFDDFLSDLKGGRSELSLSITLSEAYTLFNDAQTQYSIAQISYYNNVNDTSAKEESEICAEELAKLQVKLVEVYAAIVDYGLSETFLTGWTEHDFENLAIQKELYDEEYVEIQAELSKLQNEYLDLQASLEFKHNNRTFTIERVLELYENGEITEQDRLTLIGKYYAALSKEATPIYIRIIQYDNRIAEKAGFSTYREYASRFVYGRDFSVDDMILINEFVQGYVPDLYKSAVSFYSQSQDVLASIYQKNITIQDYHATLNNYFGTISPAMQEAYQFMLNNNLSSIGNEEGMQQAGFTTYLPSYEMPYIYLYTQGTIDDISSFVHEFGHFYSYYINGFESDGIIDVSEIQSQTNELLFLDYYDLTPIERKSLTFYKLSQMYLTIIDGCLMDQFQAYAHENIDLLDDYNDFNDGFAMIAEMYHYDELYFGFSYDAMWAGITHNFIAPFYYLSYAVSAIPAIEIFMISLDDRELALDIYRDILDETGYRPYTELLSDNALSSPFTYEIYEKLNGLFVKILNKYQTVSYEAALPEPYHFLGLAA